MLFVKKDATEKRKDFRRLLRDEAILQFPGAFNPLCAKMIEQKGFHGVYISGAVLSADLALPDIGLTTLSEVMQRGNQIARVTDLPSFIDVDTGFGEPMSAVRTVIEAENAGLSGCHFEDQINPKRCGHLDGKELISTKRMQFKIKAAVEGRKDNNFIIMARTDARGVEGMDMAIDRAKAYVDAGADVIFPEAMQDLSEFAQMVKALDVPVLANMTEFGKSALFSLDELANIGIKIVIYPVTTLRLAMGACDKGLQFIKDEGHQNNALGLMQHRRDLYSLLDYEKYNQYDKNLFNFKVGDTPNR